MKAAAWGVLALVLTTLAAPGLPSHEAGRCAPPAADAHAKASSFAPHSHSRSHLYGSPIQQPILKSHPKPKPHQPHLVTSPLPGS
jgi:hypothetical protein